MQAQQQTSKRLDSIRVILAAVCLSLTVAVAGASVCKTYRLEVPDPAELQLKDGEQVIASTSTPNGRLEARVTVKGGVASQPRFYLGGRLFEKIPESNVPVEVRECLKSSQRAQNTYSSNLLGNMWRPAPSLVAPVAYSKEPKIKCVILSSGCLGRYCFATACCEVGAFAECAYHATRILN